MLEEIRGINTRSVIACKKYLGEWAAKNKEEMKGWNTNQSVFLLGILALVQADKRDAAVELVNEFISDLHVSAISPEFGARSLKLLDVAARILQ